MSISYVLESLVTSIRDRVKAELFAFLSVGWLILIPVAAVHCSMSKGGFGFAGFAGFGPFADDVGEFGVVDDAEFAVDLIVANCVGALFGAGGSIGSGGLRFDGLVSEAGEEGSGDDL